MSERFIGLLSESEIQSLSLRVDFDPYCIQLRLPIEESEIPPLVPAVKAMRIITTPLTPNVYDVDTFVIDRDGQTIKRQSTITEMAMFYQVAKHMKPNQRITQALGYELLDSINRAITENKAQIEAHESLKKAVGL